MRCSDLHVSGDSFVELAGRPSPSNWTVPPSVRTYERAEEAWAAHADRTAGQVARDRRQSVLLANALLAVREADCGERADDEEDCRDEPHRRRIGSGSDGLDGLAPCDRADDPHFGAFRKRLVEQPAAAHLDALDEDVDQAAELTPLVEQQGSHPQLPQCPPAPS